MVRQEFERRSTRTRCVFHGDEHHVYGDLESERARGDRIDKREEW